MNAAIAQGETPKSRRVMVSETFDSSAPPEKIFALLKDISTWPSWAYVNSVKRERSGEDDPNGVGTRRRIKANLLGMDEEVELLEEIIEVVPNRRVAYMILSGIAVRDYVGETNLFKRPDGGTRIQWQSSFYPDDPSTSDQFREVVSSVFQLLLRQLSLAAEYPVPALTRSVMI
jgi:uncharacterized membrane protein